MVNAIEGFRLRGVYDFIENYPLCRSHSKDYLDGTIRYSTEDEWKRCHKVLVGSSYEI